MHALPGPDGCQSPGKDPCLFLETPRMNKTGPNKCVPGFPKPQAFKATPRAVGPGFQWAVNPIKDITYTLSQTIFGEMDPLVPFPIALRKG